MTSKDVTSVSWLISQAGGDGVADLALDPSLKGDNSNRHVISRLGLADLGDSLYFAEVPLWDRALNRESQPHA